MSVFIAILGYFAGFLSIIAFVPQAIKTITSKQTKHISLMTYIIYNCANLAFLLFGLLSIVLPVMWPSTATTADIWIWGSTLIITYGVTISAANCIIYVKVKNIKKFGEKASE